MLTAGDVTGLYAIIPTPALPEAGGWHHTGPTVDVEETARVVDRLVGDGVDGVIALGTTGECPTIPAGEHATVVGTVVDAVAGRVPVVCGATALGWSDVRDRLAVVRDAGADGALLGLPMWQPLTEDMAVEYFAAVSAAFPDLAIMVYANQRAFRFPFSTSVDFWRRVAARAPTVTSAKFSRAEAVATLREATGRRIHFLPSDLVVEDFWARDPQAVTACWATAASMGPWPCRALMDAVTASDETELHRIAAEIRWSNEPLLGLIGDPEEFAKFNVQVEKIRINAAGYCDAGPVRPPYGTVPAAVAEAAAESGRRWVTLDDRYRPPGRPNSTPRSER